MSGPQVSMSGPRVSMSGPRESMLGHEIVCRGPNLAMPGPQDSETCVFLSLEAPYTHNYTIKQYFFRTPIHTQLHNKTIFPYPPNYNFSVTGTAIEQF